MAIIININVALAERKERNRTYREGWNNHGESFYTKVKNGKAKAIRFSTLESICKALDCKPGAILEYRNDS